MAPETTAKAGGKARKGDKKSSSSQLTKERTRILKKYSPMKKKQKGRSRKQRDAGDEDSAPAIPPPITLTQAGFVGGIEIEQTPPRFQEDLPGSLAGNLQTVPDNNHQVFSIHELDGMQGTMLLYNCYPSPLL